MAPAKDGKIFYTVSSTNYYFSEGLGEMLGAPSGRLMVYDPVTNSSKVLQEHVHFANGIILSHEEDYVIFAECLRFRLHKYFISGPKAGSEQLMLNYLIMQLIFNDFLRVYRNISRCASWFTGQPKPQP